MDGAVEEGVELFKEALERAEPSEAGITPRLCWLLNGLGILYDQYQRMRLTEDTQRRALSVQKASGSSNSVDIILTIHELGRLARHLEAFEKAEAIYRRELAVLL